MGSISTGPALASAKSYLRMNPSLDEAEVPGPQPASWPDQSGQGGP